jgi:hypothetical protein
MNLAIFNGFENMSSLLRKQINMPNICDLDCLKKFEYLLSQKFVMQKENSLPENMKFKAKLQRAGLAKGVHIEVYINNNIEIKASPKIQPSFDTMYTEIENLLKESVIMISGQDVLRVNRAKEILRYIQTISVDDEVGRMTIVVLCDIILDLIVTEKLSQFTHNRQDLENESVGAKIDLLENKYKVTLYRPKSIRDVRDLRNKIAHGGAPTSRDDAIFARDATIDIFGLF